MMNEMPYKKKWSAIESAVILLIETINKDLGIFINSGSVDHHRT